MDKSWIKEDRDSLKYSEGVETFLDLVKKNSYNPKKVRCPCSKCVNFKRLSVRVIRGHLFQYGFSLSYTNWIWHGEPTLSGCGSKPSGSVKPSFPENKSETVNMCEAAFNEGEYDAESYEFKKFVEEAETPLFEDSEHTKLEALVKLHNLKARFGLSDTCFSEFLDTIGSLLPKDNVLPQSTYEAKKTLANLGLEYVKIYACPNDCMLYWKDNSDATSCPKCGASCWKLRKDNTVRVGIAAKVLWYFPIIARFKRMFQSASIAELLTWHAQNRSRDENMCHPVDSPAWKLVDYLWAEFASEIRNLSVVKQFNAETGRTGKPRVTRLHGVAEQVGGVECGYYVMQFMKEIVNDETLSFPTKWAGKKRKPYDQSKIDEVRLEVADYIQALL